jgi:tetratricopeptide (TPR) repeat protein
MTRGSDRMTLPCVLHIVRVVSLIGAAALLVACPSSKKASTTPKTETALKTSADGGVAPQDMDPVMGDNVKDGTIPGTGGQTGAGSQPTGAGSQPTAGGGTTTQPATSPAEPAKPEIKPPGQDLPSDRRDALVNDHLTRGDQALAGRDADTAIREARAALELDETNVPAMVILAHGYYLKEYDDKAEAVLLIAKARPEAQSNAKLWMLLGLVYERAPLGARENEALTAYERAATIKPDYLAAQTNRGAIYLKRKRYADAVVVFEAVARMDDRSARAHCALGSAYRGYSADPGQTRDDLLRKAENEYRVAMARDPAYQQSYYNMGLLYLDADPFPGMDTVTRLQNAVRFLGEYKRLAGPASAEFVDKTLEKAEKDLKKEQDRLERKRKKEAEEAKKKAAEGGGNP